MEHQQPIESESSGEKRSLETRVWSLFRLEGQK